MDNKKPKGWVCNSCGNFIDVEEGFIEVFEKDKDRSKNGIDYEIIQSMCEECMWYERQQDMLNDMRIREENGE